MGLRTELANFIEADVPSIAINTTIYHGIDFTSKDIDIEGCEIITVEPKATGGHASCSKSVEFNFVGSLDGVNFETKPFVVVSIDLNGTTAVRGPSEFLFIFSLKKIRLYSIKNTETTADYTATAVNVAYGIRT